MHQEGRGVAFPTPRGCTEKIREILIATECARREAEPGARWAVLNG
jgi:hypothetical protein